MFARFEAVRTVLRATHVKRYSNPSLYAAKNSPSQGYENETWNGILLSMTIFSRIVHSLRSWRETRAGIRGGGDWFFDLTGDDLYYC